MTDPREKVIILGLPYSDTENWVKARFVRDPGKSVAPKFIPAGGGSSLRGEFQGVYIDECNGFTEEMWEKLKK